MVQKIKTVNYSGSFFQTNIIHKAKFIAVVCLGGISFGDLDSKTYPTFY